MPTAAAISRRGVLALGAGLIGLGAPVAKAASADPGKWKRGINAWPWFSLTREYPAPRLDYAWPPFQDGRPVPRAEDLARLADAGFDFLRLPVDPGPFMDAKGEHKNLLMAMLFDAIRAVRSAGLDVIVNIQPNEATHYYRSRTMISDTTAPLFEVYRAFVVEVAQGLASLSSSGVALEAVNEPPQECTSDEWPATQNALLGSARAAAAGLPLVATGACGSMVRGLDALDPGPLAPLEPLLFTFHFYEPYLFSHQGAPWMREPVYRSLNAVPWPASAGSLEQTLSSVKARMAIDPARSPDEKRAAMDITERLMRQYFDAAPDKRFIAGYLDHVSNWARRHGIEPHRILMGEFGAVKTTGSIVASKPADRIRYVRDVREAAEERGFGWAFWNLFDSMGLIDDRTRVFDPGLIDALGLRMPSR